MVRFCAACFGCIIALQSLDEASSTLSVDGQAVKSGLLAEFQRMQDEDDPALTKITWIAELHMPVSDQAIRYFAATHWWNLVLAGAYYDGNFYNRAFYSPTDLHVFADDWFTNTTYYYTCTAIADPAYWNPRTRIGPLQWRPQRNAIVRFTSKKGILWEIPDSIFSVENPAEFKRALGFFDGHAEAKLTSDLLPPIPQGEGPYPLRQTGIPVLHTLDGLRGKDVN